jgi:alpha-beta hydrolase superfamily lysophospholipase
MPSGKPRKNFIGFKLMAAVNPRYKKIDQYYKQELQPEKITVPVLVIHSKADEVVPIKQSKQFFDKLAGPKKFVQLQTADHALVLSRELEDVIREIDGWLHQLS